MQEDDLTREYLNARIGKARQLRKLVETKGFEEIATIGHQMAGSGGTYGFPELSELGRTLERAGNDGDMETVGTTVMQIETVLEKLASDHA